MNTETNLTRLILKTLALILILSLGLIPLMGSSFGKLSLYNWLLPGRDRLPFSDTPQQAYNLSLFNLEAMFASHQVSADNLQGPEVRVFLLGDSATWGTLLRPEETLAGQLNQLDLANSDGVPLRFYNLGYPTLSLSKDLLLLNEALRYEPDLILWLVTLESFPADKQLSSPLVENNPLAVRSTFDKLDLDPAAYGVEQLGQSYWDSTLFGQRRNLADLIRLQLYGVMWWITGIDQYYPTEYQEAARDLADDLEFHGWLEGEMTQDQLALEILAAGKELAGDTPLLLVNEPILVSQGSNSDLRYNFYYPRWAYDEYRALLGQYVLDQDLPYIDAWDLVPQDQFTNTAIHTTPQGVKTLADELAPWIQEILDPR